MNPISTNKDAPMTSNLKGSAAGANFCENSKTVNGFAITQTMTAKGKSPTVKTLITSLNNAFALSRSPLPNS
jgi:hypothetical protein